MPLISCKNKLNVVFSNKIDDQSLIVARLDNLGKGACGSTIQNLNLMLGFEDYCGLKIK